LEDRGVDGNSILKWIYLAKVRSADGRLS